MENALNGLTLEPESEPEAEPESEPEPRQMSTISVDENTLLFKPQQIRCRSNLLFQHGDEVSENTTVVYQKKLLQDEQELKQRKKVTDAPWFKLTYVTDTLVNVKIHREDDGDSFATLSKGSHIPTVRVAWLKGIPCFERIAGYQDMLPPGYRFNLERTLLKGYLPLNWKREPIWECGIVLVHVDDYGDAAVRTSITVLSIDRY